MHPRQHSQTRTAPTGWLPALVILLSLFAIRPSSHGADSPLVIPFQGLITDPSSTPVASGQYSIIFNLYDVAVGGQPLWTERHSKVGVVNGMVNVFLGSITSLAAVDFSQTRYLGITVDVDDKPSTADPEMVPRQMIIPAFHAKNAEKLAGFDWSAAFTSADPSTAFVKSTRIAADTINTTQIINAAVTTSKIADGSITSAKLDPSVFQGTNPPGSILAFAGATAPAGYLLCDGSTVSRTTYPALFAAISTAYGSPDGSTFKLPDLRGQFLRGHILNELLSCIGSAESNNVWIAGPNQLTRTGMKIKVSGTPVTGLSLNKVYYLITVSDASRGTDASIAFALTAADALAGTKVPISGSADSMKVSQAEDPDSTLRFPSANGGNSGSAVGSMQSDAFQGHAHKSYADWFSTAFTPRNRIDTTGSSGGTWNNNVLEPITDGVNGDPRVSSETRPSNVYVNYIIKY